MTDKKPHPLEDLLNITPGSTVEALRPEIPEAAKSMIDHSTGSIIPRKVSDVTDPDIDTEERIDDLQLDAKLETLHTTALDAFESQHRLSQEVDPKFSARNAEVAAQFLNIALNSINSKVDARYKRSKVRIAKANVGRPTQVQTNVIIADRNSMLKTMLDNGMMKEVKDEPEALTMPS